MNSYAFHISLYDLACLGMIFIGLTFALLLWSAKSTKRTANGVLALALVVVALWMARILGINVRLEAYLPGLERLPMQFSLALGPLLYFYVRKITRPGYKFSWMDLLHFIPLLLEQFAFALAIKESIKTGLPTYDTLIFHRLGQVLRLAAFISVAGYLYWSRKLINGFYKRRQPVLMDRHRDEFRWLDRLLKQFGLVWLLWIPLTATAYWFSISQWGMLAYPLYLLSAIMFTRIAVVVFLRLDVETVVTAQPAARTLPTDEVKKKGAWLKKTMEAGRFYEDADLSLASLAEKLEIHPHELSRIINIALKKNFYDFINEYRVIEVARKMQNPAYNRMTLLGIAFESGFNSKTSFNRTFKQMTGKSPAEYKNELKKERPLDKLEPFPVIRPVILLRDTPPKWSHTKVNRNAMLRNYFKTAWRNITANKLFATLNIAGLAIGVCVCITLFACASYELGFDRMYKNWKDIYRINLQASGQYNNQVWAQLPGIAGPAFLHGIPQVKAMTRLLKQDFGGIISIKTGEKNFSETGLYMADTSILKIFDFKFTEGDARTAFAEPKSVIISESAKARLYGKQPVIGKIIYVNNEDTLHVSGVYKDLPQNSTIDCDMIYSIMDSWAGKEVYWGNSSYETYCLLQPGANIQQVQKLADAIADKSLPPKGRFFTGFLL